MQSKIKPNFIGIGFQRCGTSWLNNILFEHPEVGKPISGLHFFTDNFSKGEGWYEEKLAKHLHGERILGEFSTPYCYPNSAPTVAERIHSLYPDVKLIFSIRHPVKRCESDFKRLVRIGKIKETKITFESAIEYYPAIRERSLYSPVLSQFYSRFPKSNIHIIRFDDIENNSHDVVKKLFSFLNIDQEFVPPSVTNPLGSTYKMQSILLERSIIQIQERVQILLRHFPKNSSTSVRKIGKYFVKKLRKLNLSSSINDNEVMMKLGSEFKNDLIETMHLTGLDLEEWLE